VRVRGQTYPTFPKGRTYGYISGCSCLLSLRERDGHTILVSADHSLNVIWQNLEYASRRAPCLRTRLLLVSDSWTSLLSP
jgi:hypothetical protein